jgi:uncharacterized Ntn-hydrolase superfamily protein
MTYSIVAFDPTTGDLGVAVQSKFLAVGAVVPWATAGVGAVATQSFANVAYGPDGLASLRAGMSAADTLAALTAADPLRDQRQAGIVDARGGSATFTGRGCLAWAGGRTGSGWAAQGNILAGAGVVDGLADTYLAGGAPFPELLVNCLLAADAAGGDRRGRESAALLVVRAGGGYGGGNDRYIDLRVDDHPEAPAELARLFQIWDDTMLVRNDPLLEATVVLVADLQQRMAALGVYKGEVSGSFDEPTRAALSDWAGTNNLEGRLRTDDLISRLLVREMRDVTPEIPEIPAP